MILATWFKQKLRHSLRIDAKPKMNKSRTSPLHYYIDQNKIEGLNVTDKNINEKIYRQYLKAFEKGVYNYIKEEYNPTTNTLMSRKYFSGGFFNNFASSSTLNIKKFPSHGASRKKNMNTLIALGTAAVLISCNVIAQEQTTKNEARSPVAASTKIVVNDPFINNLIEHIQAESSEDFYFPSDELFSSEVNIFNIEGFLLRFDDSEHDGVVDPFETAKKIRKDAFLSQAQKNKLNVAIQKSLISTNQNKILRILYLNRITPIH